MVEVVERSLASQLDGCLVPSSHSKSLCYSSKGRISIYLDDDNDRSA